MGRIDTDFVQLQPVAVDEATGIRDVYSFYLVLRNNQTPEGQGVAGAHT